MTLKHMATGADSSTWTVERASVSGQLFPYENRSSGCPSHVGGRVNESFSRRFIVYLYGISPMNYPERETRLNACTTHGSGCLHTLGAVYDVTGPASLHGTFPPTHEFHSNYTDVLCATRAAEGEESTLLYVLSHTTPIQTFI